MTPHRARTLTTIPDLAELNAECEHGPPSAYRYPIIYGKGDMGQMAREFCAAIGYKDVRMIDQQDFSATAEIKADWLVLVAVARWPYVPIERALTAESYQHIAPFNDWTENFPVHPLKNGWFAEPLDLDAVQTVLDMFADDVSRAHYVQFLAWRRLREEWTFEGAPVDVHGPRYWPHEVASVLVQDHEVFIDGGSYDGKVSAAFRYRFGGETVMIDPEGQPNIHCALGISDRRTRFRGGYGYASRLWNLDEPVDDALMVDQRRLDSLDTAPTFIKLHLEGEELNALRGATNTIRTHRPILTVTTYHNSDGIDRIPTFLRDRCPDYRFLWRNSAYVGEGSVMFAIPKDRAA